MECPATARPLALGDAGVGLESLTEKFASTETVCGYMATNGAVLFGYGATNSWSQDLLEEMSRYRRSFRLKRCWSRRTFSFKSSEIESFLVRFRAVLVVSWRLVSVEEINGKGGSSFTERDANSSGVPSGPSLSLTAQIRAATSIFQVPVRSAAHRIVATCALLRPFPPANSSIHSGCPRR
jgi:hypothetical protein